MGRGTRGEEEYISGKQRGRENDCKGKKRRRGRGESMKVDLIYGCDTLQRL